MTARQLIQRLENLIREHGNCSVYIYDPEICFLDLPDVNNVVYEANRDGDDGFFINAPTD
jgi:hypothetical protein